MTVRVTIDTLPGEVVIAFADGPSGDDDTVFKAAFSATAWPCFVEAVISAAPFGVPPALDIDEITPGP